MMKFKFWPKWAQSAVWLAVSLAAALIVWVIVSNIGNVGRIFVPPDVVLKALKKTISDGTLWENVADSLIRVLGGFAIGAIASLPVAFLLGWYKTFRQIVEPWIQFLRTIPPIALIPIIIVVFGIGTTAKLAIISFAVFLTMVVTIYQGIKNVDSTLIKAAKVYDAKDGKIFLHVVVPASIPFIFTGLRLGIATAMTTLVAAELTGGITGIGTMIQRAGAYFEMDIVLMGIIVIGVIGFALDKVILFLETKLTSWQEVR